MQTYSDARDKAVSLLSSVQHNKKSVKRELDAIAELERQIEVKEQAVLLCKACIDSEQSVVDYLNNLVTSVLSVAFNKPVRFVLAKVTDDNGLLTGLQPMIDTGDGYDEFEPASEAGDGYQAVASFALRIGFLLLNQELTPIMIYDEPLKTVNPVVWQRLIDFLNELSKLMDFQFIVVTHVPCGFPLTYRVSKNGVFSVLEKWYTNNDEE